MKAQRIDGQTPGGKRTRLADVLPLSTPFSVQIFPVYGCNLACAYWSSADLLRERLCWTTRSIGNVLMG